MRPRSHLAQVSNAGRPLSYRSFKRVLGETNLERKCRFFFGFCLLFLIAGSFWWYGAQTEKIVVQNMRTTARTLVWPALLKIHSIAYYEPPKDVEERSVGDRITYEEQLKYWQEFWASSDDDPQILKPESLKPEKLPQTEAEKAIVASLRALEPYLPATRTDGKSVETEPFHEGRDNQTGDFLYYFPVWAEDKQCYGCHNTFDIAALAVAGKAPPELEYKQGDLLGVVKVTLPYTQTQSAINYNRALFCATAIMTFFLAMLAAYVIVRYVIVKPLKHLRDVSDEVALGNIQARADIHTADEFEDLARAFNKMLRHLTDVQAEIRQANTSLDLKVDELAQLNMRLYEMNRLKSDFLATMSHELRTPLNSIIGFSDVLGSIKSLDDKQKRYVQNIQKSGRMLLDMINDILDLAKIESGKMDVRLSEFAIDDLIAAQCDMARPLAEKKNIDVDCDIEHGLPLMFQDQGKVQQILNNLLSNAIKFTPEGGRIVIAARRSEDGTLLLSVADTGIGIAEADQTSIFEKFRQGGAVLSGGDAMTREHSGTGLGLSIVKELCKLLGGEVYLESQLGKGSTFTVVLPFSRADQPRFDSSLDENLGELVRTRREELQRAMSGEELLRDRAG
jgi:two-component system sensor histidine kinase BarA